MDLMETDDVCTEMPTCCIRSCPISQDEPKDLSIKRKLRPVPPPLDLTKRTLGLEQLSGLTFSPRSPLSQKNLPLRKRFVQYSGTLSSSPRAFSWSSNPENLQLQLPQDSCAEINNIDSRGFHHTELPTSASVSSLRMTELSTPHTPPTPHPNSAIPVISNRFVFGDTGYINNASHAPLNLSTGSMIGFPSSLLSPAPSHRSSSLSSSREELEPEVSQDFQIQVHPHHNTELTGITHQVKTEFNNNMGRINETVFTTLSKHSPVWSVFQSGVQIHFVFGSTHQITSATTSDRLSHIERRAYAPNGLHLIRLSNHLDSSGQQCCQLYMRPIMSQQEDIIAMPLVSHPFYVREKGWCSVNPEQTNENYNISCCQVLQEGDLILPQNHPEISLVQIPVLTEAMQKFDFNDENFESASQAAMIQPNVGTTAQNQRLILISPPASPSKKIISKASGNENLPTTSRSRRPMNGFMLFAKYHRLKLIQQYPGKDNRAISVLLGSMWKGLVEEERDKFNAEARLQAEERKRIDPDCWKRKRSHSTS